MRGCCQGTTRSHSGSQSGGERVFQGPRSAGGVVLGEHKDWRLAEGGTSDQLALPFCSSSGFQIGDLDERPS